MGPAVGISRSGLTEVDMLDVFYVGVVVVFFVLLWGFTRASERF